MDGLSYQMFSEDPVGVWIGSESVGATVSEALLGRPHPPESLARLIGSPGNLFAAAEASNAPHPQITIDVCGTGTDFDVDMTRHIQTTSDDEVEVYHDGMSVQNAGRGYGSRIFARAVVEYRSVGIRQIRTYASKGGINIGYYLWPRLGFNMALDPALKIRARLNGYADVDCTNDLFMKYEAEDAAAFWKAYGHGGEAHFDLTPKSIQSSVLDNYLTIKNIVVK